MKGTCVKSGENCCRSAFIPFRVRNGTDLCTYLNIKGVNIGTELRPGCLDSKIPLLTVRLTLKYSVLIGKEPHNANHSVGLNGGKFLVPSLTLFAKFSNCSVRKVVGYNNVVVSDKLFVVGNHLSRILKVLHRDIVVCTCSRNIPLSVKLFSSWMRRPTSSALGLPTPETSTKKLFPKSRLVTFSPSMMLNLPIPKASEHAQALVGNTNKKWPK